MKLLQCVAVCAVQDADKPVSLCCFANIRLVSCGKATAETYGTCDNEQKLTLALQRVLQHVGFECNSD